MSLNTVAVTGILPRAPSTKFEGDNGRQVTTFTLRCDERGSDGVVHPLYVPVECYGRSAEQAATLSAEDVIAIEGKLKWRSFIDKHGEKRSTLCVLARQVAVLTPAAAEVGT